MTPQEETEMHRLAEQLAELTKGTGWEAMRYHSISSTLERLTEYCATCECQVQMNRERAKRK